jgi:uncharacterized membrane protein (UPF0127 family)
VTPRGRAVAAGARLGKLPVHDLPGGLQLYVADSGKARRRGLARVDAMPPHWGLHLRPCRSVHTFGMRFPIDLVWLDRDGRVRRVDEGVVPGRVVTCLRALSVVETRAGSGARFAAAV